MVCRAEVDCAVHDRRRRRDDGFVLREQLRERQAERGAAAGGVEDHHHAVVLADVDKTVGDRRGGDDGGLAAVRLTEPKVRTGGASAASGFESV